jgi:His-Xaa-Ser system protein HxsD
MEEDEKNLEINEKDGYAVVKVNPKIYPLDVIYSAAYVFLDRVYLSLDGDPEKEVKIELRLKSLKSIKEELEKLGREFFNELLNYSFYKKQAEKNQSVRETLLKTALNTNIQEECSPIEEYLEDPGGISIPWEEKYGDKTNSLKNNKKEEEYLEDPEGISIPWEEKYGENGVNDK